MFGCQGKNSFPISRETAFSQVPLGGRITWRLCLCFFGLMAATVHIVPLALLNIRPTQRLLLSLGFCPQRSVQAHVLLTQNNVQLIVSGGRQLNTGQCTGSGVASDGVIPGEPSSRAKRPNKWNWVYVLFCSERSSVPTRL